MHVVTVVPDPEGDGFNHTEFEQGVRVLMKLFSAYFPPGREEDVFKALSWYYSPWPHIDDLELNREAFNKVGNNIVVIIVAIEVG